jgi:aspartate/methionine/tyrosine aminotransferase
VNNGESGKVARPWLATGSERLRAIDAPIIPRLAALAGMHEDPFSFGQGVAFFPPPPEAKDGAEAFWRELAPHGYGPAAGLDALVKAIGRKLEEENGFVGVGSDWRVMVTAGANMAFLNALLAVADPGDEVLLPLPWYFNHEMAVRMANCVPVAVQPGAGLRPDPEAFVRAISPRTRVVVTVSPNNPTGLVYTAEELAAINRLAAERGLWHISDETYEYFVYDGARHTSPGAPGNHHTITLGSFSKAWGMASWRIGWLLAPPSLWPALVKVQDTNLICAPHISQFAALGALKAGAAWPRRHLETLSIHAAQLRAALMRLGPAVTAIVGGEGALYLFVCFDTALCSSRLAERLVQEHGLVTLPGSAFGLDDACWLRLSFGALSKHSIDRGLARLVAGLGDILQGHAEAMDEAGQ